MASSAKSSGGRGVSWRERETLDLIAIWGEQKVQEALRSRHSNIDVFEKISEKMVTRGHNRSALECRNKTKVLRKEYKRAVMHDNIYGNSHKRCPYYNELHRIFQGNASVNPVHVSKSLDQRLVFDSPQEMPEVAKGSEEFFSQEFNTINMADICSSPAPTVHDPSPDGQNDIEEADEAMITTAIPCDPKDGNMVEEQRSTQPQATLSPNGAASSGASGSTRRCRTGVQLSSASKLANGRTRKRRVSMLNDVARQMLRQCELEAQSARQRHEELMAAEEKSHKREDRRWERFLEEARLDRETFSGAMGRSTEAIISVVDAICSLCTSQRSQEQPKETECSVLGENNENRNQSNKRACVGKRRDRLDL